FANALEQASRPESRLASPGNVITLSNLPTPQPAPPQSFSAGTEPGSLMAGRSSSGPDRTTVSSQPLQPGSANSSLNRTSDGESPTLMAAPFVTQPTVVSTPVFSESKLQPGRRVSRRLVVA